MADTHALTTQTYTVVERVLDCDGACVADEFVKSPSVVEWVGLPPRLREMIERLSVKADPPPPGFAGVV